MQLHVKLLGLVPCNHLVELVRLGEHVGNVDGNLLRLGVLVLSVLGGGEGGASSFLLSTASSSDLSLQAPRQTFS